MRATRFARWLAHAATLVPRALALPWREAGAMGMHARRPAAPRAMCAGAAEAR